jgi:hypothetical protein
VLCLRSFFVLGYFLDRFLIFTRGLASGCSPLTYASLIAGITDMCHHGWLIC